MFLSQYTREFRYNLKLAYPVVVGLLGHTIVQLVDNLMVGQLGTAELAAVSLGNSFVFVGMSLGIGFSTAITPLVAESDGAGNISKGRKILFHSILLCFLLGSILSFAVLTAQPLLYHMGQQAEVAQLAFPYLFWVGLSLIPLVGFQAFKQFSDGLSHTRPPMYATIFANVVNVVLNYFLIFGKGPFPAMGIVGAALGTFIARWCMVIFLIVYMRLDFRFEAFIRKIKIKVLDLMLFKKIIALGFPSAMQMFFEVLFFTLAIWMSGFLGKNPQAANQIALNLSSITYMVAMGLGVTAMIRVGNQKGKGDFVTLRRVALSIFLLIVLIDIFFCGFFLAFNELLPTFYLDNNNPMISQDVNEVISMAATLLIISGFFQISDGLQAVVLGSLRGLQDVNIPAGIAFFSYMVFGAPISYYLGIFTDRGVTGIWIGLLSGLIVSALLLFIRFEYLTKKLIRQHDA